MKREVLCKIPMVYAIGTINIENKTYVIAASEKKEGAAYLIDPVSGKTDLIWDGPGGVMAMIGCPGNRILSIDEFYPVFDSAAAAVYVTEISGDSNIGFAYNKRKLFDLPWCHRVAFAHMCDGDYVIAASLCKKKEYIDDWSKNGSVYAMKVTDRIESDGSLTEIFPEVISHHHAMWVKKGATGFDEVFVGGTEGTFKVTKEEDGWHFEKILSVPTSEIVIYDLDGDGEEEIAVIEGFHGGKLGVYKKDGEAPIVSMDFDFGHVLWGGDINGKPVLLLGTRGEEMFLKLLKLKKQSDVWELEEMVLDMGVGPSQAVVEVIDGQLFIFAADHEINAVVAYCL